MTTMKQCIRKRRLSDIVLGDIDVSLPMRDIFRQEWFNLFPFTVEHSD